MVGKDESFFCRVVWIEWKSENIPKNLLPTGFFTQVKEPQPFGLRDVSPQPSSLLTDSIDTSQRVPMRQLFRGSTFYRPQWLGFCRNPWSSLTRPNHKITTGCFGNKLVWLSRQINFASGFRGGFLFNCCAVFTFSNHSFFMVIIF